MKQKKANSQIGTAIILIALILLLGGLFIDNDSEIKYKYKKQKNKNQYENNQQNYPQEDYLFYINETDIGRAKKEIDNFPNIEIGSKIESNIIFVGNNFKLSANPFSKTHYSFNLNIDELEDVNNLYLYFNPNRLNGKQDLEILVNDKIYYENKAFKEEIPINIRLDNLKNQNQNLSNLKITFQLKKPKIYQLFNWNSFEINQLKVMEKRHSKENNLKEFSFQVDKDFINQTYINLIFKCSETKSNEPIKIDVNGFTIDNFNPDCQKINKIITKNIPTNILNQKNNKLTFNTKGHYKLSYSLNKIYFNDKDEYKFKIGNFNNIIDIVIYGEFDKNIIDLKINNHLIGLRDSQVKSILNYLKYGTNEIEILTKPLGIEELIIEKNDFLYE